MNKIEKTINEYNLEAKFERRDIVSTWWSAMQKMKVEQLQYDRSRWRPIRTFPGYKVGQGHNICFDQILG